MLYMFRCVLTRQTVLYRFEHRSYHWKTVSLKNAVFDLSWPLTLKRLILGEICLRLSERAFQELSFAFFWIWRSYYSSRDNGRHSWKKHHFFRKFDLWWPLLTSIFTWAKKWPKWLRTGSLRAVDRRIARPSSFPSFRVRGGVILAPPPTMAKVAETATRARVKGTVPPCSKLSFIPKLCVKRFSTFHWSCRSLLSQENIAWLARNQRLQFNKSRFCDVIWRQSLHFAFPIHLWRTTYTVVLLFKTPSCQPQLSAEWYCNVIIP